MPCDGVHVAIVAATAAAAAASVVGSTYRARNSITNSIIIPLVV